MINSDYSFIQILAFSLIGISLYLISLFTGLFLYQVELQNKTRSFAINSFLGIITIVCLYSFFNVGLRTMNVVAFIGLMYFVYMNRNRFRIKKLEYKTLVPILYIFPIVFLLYGIFTLPESIENDVRYYAKIAYSLGEFKQENFYHFYNSYDKGFNGLIPYHYTELWLTSLINKVFNVKSIIALRYFTYPFLIASICYGTLGFIKGKKFVFFVLFLSLTTLPLYSFVRWIDIGYLVYTDFWLRPNFIIYYYCLLPLFYFIYEKKWDELVAISIVVSTSSIIIIPCLFSGIFAVLTCAVMSKYLSIRKWLILTSALLITCLFIFLIMKFMSPSINILINQSIGDVLLSTLRLWKAVLFIMTILIAESSFLVLIGFLINKWILKDKEYNFIYIFIMTQILVGVFIFQLLNQMDNTYQFPYIAYAASGFLVILTILSLMNKIKSIL